MLSKLFIFPFCFLVWSFLAPQLVFGQSSIDFQNLIASKEYELNELNKKIKDIEEKSKLISLDLLKTSSELEKLDRELVYYENEIEKINLFRQRSLLEIEIHKSKKKELSLIQNAASKITYKNWRSSNILQKTSIFFVTELYDPKRYEKYNDTYFSNVDLSITDVSRNILFLDEQISRTAEGINDFNKIKKDLVAKKAEIQQSLYLLSNERNSYRKEYLSISDNINKLKSDITFLSNEQKKAIEREIMMLANANPSNNQVSLQPGEFYFKGQGRDLYQGHGVGMSQFGAHGAALNGYSYDQILKFYYQGVEISDLHHTQNIMVDGYGYMDIEDYVSGQGEVPAYACGTQDQIDEWRIYADVQGWEHNDPRRKKYVIDDTSTIWDCWPEEAIKAQVVAFRTYALNYVSRKGSICTSAACQVYKNNKNSAWAAEETKGKVITYSGELIEALYSSDNNQGYGTANNDTVFTNFHGDGTPYPYLRSVNDSTFATKTFYSNWKYNTRKYTFESIFQMLSYIAYAPNSDIDRYDSFVRNNTKSLINGSISINSISLELDPSKRVKKVFIQFDNGSIKSISGYWFKYMWNVWSFYTGSYDYIYSQTFALAYE